MRVEICDVGSTCSFFLYFQYIYSLKEAIYKAAHPLLCQYVAFKEAEVTPHPDGTATCEWFLESRAHKSIASMTAHWIKLEDRGFFLTSARVQGSLEEECDLRY
jgi:4'-phosphopantetheinyl transferase EntD